jgi:hypothetical protein
MDDTHTGREKRTAMSVPCKRILKLDRLRRRGPNGAEDECVLAATAHNPGKLAKLPIQCALAATA